MPEPSLATADAYLSMSTAAERYDVHRDTIKRAIERGDLPAVRVGTRGLIRVRIADLECWARPVRNGDGQGWAPPVTRRENADG